MTRVIRIGVMRIKRQWWCQRVEIIKISCEQAWLFFDSATAKLDQATKVYEFPFLYCEGGSTSVPHFTILSVLITRVFSLS